MVVWFPEVTAKEMVHGPAQVPRTASAAQTCRQASALGNRVIALDHSQNHRITVVTIRERLGIMLMLAYYYALCG